MFLSPTSQVYRYSHDNYGWISLRELATQTRDDYLACCLHARDISSLQEGFWVTCVLHFGALERQQTIANRQGDEPAWMLPDLVLGKSLDYPEACRNPRARDSCQEIGLCEWLNKHDEIEGISRTCFLVNANLDNYDEIIMQAGNEQFVEGHQVKGFPVGTVIDGYISQEYNPDTSDLSLLLPRRRLPRDATASVLLEALEDLERNLQDNLDAGRGTTEHGGLESYF